jgi:heat shock protein HtpX
MVVAGIGALGVAGTWSQHRTVAELFAVFYFEVVLVQIPSLVRSGGVVYRRDLAERVAAPLRELTEVARCPVPRVTMRDDFLRVAAVAQGAGATRLILSSQWADRVSDRELRAIIAHELAHVIHSDLRTLKTRAQVTGVLSVAAAVALTVVVTGTLNFAMYVALIPICMLGSRLVVSLLNRPLERRADDTGARLCGDPDGLAIALTEATSFRDQARRELYGTGPWRWLIFPLSVTMPSHPATSERIKALSANRI